MMEKGNRKREATRAQENEIVVKATSDKFEIMKKRSDAKKKCAIQYMEQAWKTLHYQISPDFLNTKLKDLPAMGCNLVNHCVATPAAVASSSDGILRIPNPGEYAVSAYGSPLMVPTNANCIVNANLPLKMERKLLFYLMLE